MSREYVFGPVASRRLGISLGVDLVTAKTCSHECIYCEAGKTDNLTTERREYVPVEEVNAQLAKVFERHPELDYITFSGAGEPTLNSRIGDVIAYIKQHSNYRICLLTNGTMLGDSELCRQLDQVDLVIPSLDASNEEEFKAVNRPPETLQYDCFLKNLIHFTQTTHARVILELFVAPGYNDSEASAHRFAEIIRQLKVDKVQLNTLDRPGVVKDLKPASAATLALFLEILNPIVAVEPVGAFQYHLNSLRTVGDCRDLRRKIMDLASRRPVTLPDLTVALGAKEQDIQHALIHLADIGQIHKEVQERGVFYTAIQNEMRV